MPVGRHVPSSASIEPCAWTGPSLSKTEGRKPTPSTGHMHAAGLGMSAAQVGVCE